MHAAMIFVLGLSVPSWTAEAKGFRISVPTQLVAIGAKARNALKRPAGNSTLLRRTIMGIWAATLIGTGSTSYSIDSRFYATETEQHVVATSTYLNDVIETVHLIASGEQADSSKVLAQILLQWSNYTGDYDFVQQMYAAPEKRKLELLRQQLLHLNIVQVRRSMNKALITAVQTNDLPVLRNMLAYDLASSVSPALIIAIENGHHIAVKLLLSNEDSYINITTLEAMLKKARQLAVRKELTTQLRRQLHREFKRAAAVGNTYTLLLMLDAANKYPNWDIRFSLNTGLVVAAGAGRVQAVAQLLEHGGTSFNAALHEAVSGGHHTVTDLLLAHGKNIISLNKGLQAAARANNLYALRRFLKLGAHNLNGALETAAYYLNIESAKFLLAEGANNFDLALISAMRSRHIAGELQTPTLIPILIAAGASDFEKALLIARNHHSEATVEGLRHLFANLQRH